MKNLKIFLKLLTIVLFLPLTVSAASALFRNEPKIKIHNRILVKVNGKSITTFDLAKKMDLSFYRQYPQFLDSPAARLQYYNQGWKVTLDDMVIEELILADAKESKITANAGDVRQMLEEQFGPNIIVNINKAGLTLNEAYKSVESDLILQRTIGARVNSKALRKITPIKIKQAYDEYIQNPENRALTKWNYRVLTVREKDTSASLKLADKVYQMLQAGISAENIASQLEAQDMLSKHGKITLSGEISNNEKELSAEYKKQIQDISDGSFSQPFEFKSRALKKTVHRIILLDETFVGGYPSYQEMENSLKNRLLGEAADAETKVYIEKLRQHYHIKAADITDNLPPDFEPFTASR